VDCESILGELGWLRRLARGLGADPELAEDLTQQTVLTALEHPPATDRPVRGWLRTVLRNLFAESARGRLRRHAREARAARSDAGDSTLDVVERAAVQKRVVDAVWSLEEPYRTTVLLRFFEGLPPRRIAARTGVPVATVKTRLARGLAHLRVRLDREHGGDRRAWLWCLIAPLPKAVIEASTIGVVIVQAKAKLAVAAGILLAGFAGWFAYDHFADDRVGLAPPDPGPATEAAAPEGAVPAPASGPIRPRPYQETASAAKLAEPAGDAGGAAAAAESAPAVPRVRGRVIDAHSAPVGGVPIAFRPHRDENKRDAAPADLGAAGAATATSGPDGSFEMDAPAGSGTFAAQSDRHATVLTGSYSPDAPSIEALVVVAPLRKVAGHVVDGDRRPLAGAQVVVELPENFRSTFDRILDFSQNGWWGANTDAEGRFALASTPDVAGTRLRTRLEGYEARVDPMPAADADLEIVLRRTPAVRDTIAGTVVDHAGGGVPGARVSARDRTTRTDESGRFAFKIDEKRPVPAKLVALKEGFLPAVLELTPDVLASAAPIVLRLDGTPLTIAGRVLDGDGKPLGGIQVWTPDTTAFANTRESGLELVENVLSGTRGFWVPVKTGEDGRFVIRGLLPREYRVQAMDPATLVLAEAGPFAAGSTDAAITLADDDLHETVAGVVVSRNGAPVPNVSVRPQRDAFQMSMDGGSTTSHADIPGTTTDEAGRFALKNVPKTGVYVRFEGSAILPLEFGRGEGLETAARGRKLDHLEVVVAVRCHFQVDLLDEPGLADRVGVLDAGGRPLPIDEFLGNGRRTTDHVAISGGRTSVLAVPDTAATVVFYKAGKEVGRKQVRLVPGVVAKVTP
jgi:RNA polymerase sigma factor (sigma-70 family)